jgi:NitT/TauT family transport system substrate-binding protein
MSRSMIRNSLLGFALSLAIFATRPASAEPITIGYSDWPGWVAWQVAIDKGWFKEAGVDVKFQWFDYSASMEAFAAGKIDANCMTNGDTLVTGAGGGKGIMIMLTDYSNGNDMIVGKPGIKTIPDLKGQKVGLELGFVEHLLLLNGLQKNGMTESDVTLVNSKTNETPQVLASGQVDLRRCRRQPGELEREKGRLDEDPQDLGSRRPLYQRPGYARRCRQDPGCSRRA